ncbi:hypothetical protein [Petrachloros mirabilis]
MADNFAKLWLQKQLNQGAIRRASEAIQSTGRALPCKVTAVNGSIVTVSFQVNSAPWTLPQVTIPKAESNWIRMPTQVGDFGWTVPADCYLGGVSGLGGGTADLAQPGNLSALVFVPISNQNSPPIDQDAAQIEGPNGVILRTTSGTTSSVITNANGTTVTYGTNTLVINGTEIAGTVGSSSLTITSSQITLTAGGFPVVINSSGLSINGIQFMAHEHSGVTTGTGNTGGVV